jgi:hypothetical protein
MDPRCGTEAYAARTAISRTKKVIEALASAAGLGENRLNLHLPTWILMSVYDVESAVSEAGIWPVAL